MFQKLAPLIILALFIGATIFVMWGLEHASSLAHPATAQHHQQ
ncbi:hypothetical protein [Nitratifractor sp.]